MVRLTAATVSAISTIGAAAAFVPAPASFATSGSRSSVVTTTTKSSGSIVSNTSHGKKCPCGDCSEGGSGRQHHGPFCLCNVCATARMSHSALRARPSSAGESDLSSSDVHHHHHSADCACASCETGSTSSSDTHHPAA
mmetsp:Transcript_7272/g.13219  ORF Transcript_7272/g.13219 Transcript_7272/m.13219 type:complete len:139 (+) Transcript_7272:85-501(+)|eukprot:CAMPEP_0201637192 /NCGR_PEP_ID=MMETSP0493-20130528/11350_1 /ASSEMBLY_ACC=CAM_ASM_000838 /TAXON_ID=420259 /ORGANISM="Thalassiosira gravida, Strain GMp14c1" /LENGTH=138 /DNA_ID=CAMNT_0048109627 /DNA_START=35 /DNA_END=451 /DNA_ORIENTATION=-